MTEDYSLNPRWLSTHFIETFQTAYMQNKKSSKTSNCTQLYTYPFHCASFDDFLHVNQPSSRFGSTEQLVSELEQAARQLPFTRNRGDLFSFNQSVDFANLVNQLAKLNGCKQNERSELLINLRKFFLNHVRVWIEKLTGLALIEDKIDLTASIYKKHDVLLCHDDELDNRRIAFILYLVDSDWDASNDGGLLDLFSCQKLPPQQTDVEHEQLDITSPPVPWRVVRSIVPRRNTFAFFEVSNRSYHQVTEVLGDKDRVSIHGWFHSAPSEQNESSIIPATTHVPRISPIHIEEDLVYGMINPIYLDMNQQSKIRRVFTSRSEIQLRNFLTNDTWIELCTALIKSRNKLWVHRGPYIHRHYDALCSDSSSNVELPDCVRRLQRLLTSEAMLVILSDLTGVCLHPLALSEKIESSPKRPRLDETSHDNIPERISSNGDLVNSEPIDQTQQDPVKVDTVLTEPQFRRWQAGNYTLLADSDFTDEAWRLEATMHICGYGQDSSSNLSDISDKRKPGRRHLNDKHEREKMNTCSDSKCWQSDWGGRTVYMDTEEKNELLTVHPVDGALTLVYVGPGTASFMEYLNRRSHPIASNNYLISDNIQADNQLLYSYDLSISYIEHKQDNSTNSEAGDDQESSGESNNDSTSILTESDDDSPAEDVGDGVSDGCVENG